MILLKIKEEAMLLEVMKSTMMKNTEITARNTTVNMGTMATMLVTTVTTTAIMAMNVDAEISRIQSNLLEMSTHNSVWRIASV